MEDMELCKQKNDEAYSQGWIRRTWSPRIQSLEGDLRWGKRSSYSAFGKEEDS